VLAPVLLLLGAATLGPYGDSSIGDSIAFLHISGDEGRPAIDHAVPDAPRAVPERRVVLVVCGHQRFECHAANRAVARMILLDLWMHWAGVDHFRLCSLRVKKFTRFNEPCVENYRI
jgi:hypothetical protein